MSTKWLAIGGVLLVAIFVFGAAGLAADYYVRTDGNNGNTGLANDAATAWLTIQYAVDSAPAGSTINVAAGTYTEAILIDEPLTVRGGNVRREQERVYGSSELRMG